MSLPELHRRCSAHHPSRRSISFKRLDLRVREDDPAADVERPDRGADRAKTFLYPGELLHFATSEAVPLDWRRLVTLAIYLGVRARELEALEWDDFDLTRGNVNVHRAVDRDRSARSQ